MQLFLLITILSLFAMIIWQDFKDRAIDWWLIPALFVVLCADGIMQAGTTTFLKQLSVNLMIVAVQLLVIWLYFIIKNKKVVNIIDSQIGLGDVLFFFVIAAMFEPLNFIMGYTISLLLVLGAWLMLKGKSNVLNTIPLAGGMSVVMSIFILISFLVPSIDRFQNCLLW